MDLFCFNFEIFVFTEDILMVKMEMFRSPASGLPSAPLHCINLGFSGFIPPSAAGDVTCAASVFFSSL